MVVPSLMAWPKTVSEKTHFLRVEFAFPCFVHPCNIFALQPGGPSEP
jgi:hypothetical protein